MEFYISLRFLLVIMFNTTSTVFNFTVLSDNLHFMEQICVRVQPFRNRNV